MKKRICMLLVSIFLLAALAVTASAEEKNSFVLTVSTANSMVIEPERIPYTEGQTIKEALLASGHTFTQLEEQDYIGAVDDVAGNYVILYDNGGYDVKRPASSITAMRIGVTNVSQENYDAMLSLVRRMAEYRYMENHVQNYIPAQEAYKTCLNALRGDGSAAAAGQAKLDAAIAAYQAILDGPKYTVSVKVTQGGAAVASPVFTMTDEYGNVTTGRGSSLQVIAGNYTFCVSDGGYNRTEGTLRVTTNLSNIAVDLPSGEWFGDIYFREYGTWLGYSDPYRSQRNSDEHKLTVWVDDKADFMFGLNMVCYQGDDIPDKSTTLLKTAYISTEGENMADKHQTWSSKDSTTVWGNFVRRFIDTGLDGGTFDLEAHYVNSAGHTQIQSFEIDMQRVPTLKMLAVYADGTRLRIGAETWSVGLDGQKVRPLSPEKYFKHQWEYTAVTTSDTLEISAEAFGEDYTVSGTGTIPVTSDKFDHVITVTAPDGKVSTYTLHVEKKSGVSVTLNPPANTSVQVFSDMDSEIKPLSNGSYRLLPDQKYYYVATKNNYYHTRADFTAQEGLQVTVAEPVVEDWLNDLGIFSGRRYIDNGVFDWISYPVDKQFASDNHKYTYTPDSTDHIVYLQAAAKKGTVKAIYWGQGVRDFEETLLLEHTVGDRVAEQAIEFLQDTGYSIPMTIRVEQQEEDGVLYYQNYDILFVRQMKLYELTAKAGQNEVVFETPQGEKTEFDRDVTDYVLTVDRDAESVALSGKYIPSKSNSVPRPEYWAGFYSIVNGQRYDETLELQSAFGMAGRYKSDTFTEVTIPLTREQDEECVIIQVCHIDPTSIPETYTLTIRKSDPVPVKIDADPADLLVFLTSDLTGKREYDTDGTFMLTPGRTYTYNATKAGYVGVTGSYTVPANGGTLKLKLEKAPENTALVALPSEWPHLRRDNNNNGVITAPMPTNSDNAVLYWATKIGEGFDQNACSPPILVDGDLIVYSGDKIYRVDTETGAVLATGTMCGMSSFGINPPTYANGMIFVGLSMGRVQAFNAKTLESLWVYTDPLGGQPNCSIVYHNGYVYTGFWSGEDRVNNYVCLSATDEDPGRTDETKLASWTYSSLGGFYWAGAYVCDQFTLIGTDDGKVGYTTGYARLVSLDTETGKTISEKQMDVTGDIRSSITAYEGKYYFTSKGGYFFQATVDESGTIQQVKELKLNNYATNDSTPPMSTSTPTIYNGRAYVGVSGVGQFTAYSGHNITVIDIPNWEIAYKVQTQGYPQTSGVLTTAYEAADQSVYVYFFDNYTPGKLRVLKDKPGQVSAALTSEEYGITTAMNLFEPRGDQAQYAICSPVVDSNGTIYFKNDSAYLMAVGSTIDHLEITKQPNKTAYKVGDVFDAAGIQVMAHFTNGVTRDVTQYMTWSTDPLTAEDTDFQLVYPITMYQNQDGAEGEYSKPIATVRLTISENTALCGDVNGDGEITIADAMYIFQYLGQRRTLTDDAQMAADTNKDGQITIADAMYIFQYLGQRRTLN